MFSEVAGMMLLPLSSVWFLPFIMLFVSGFGDILSSIPYNAGWLKIVPRNMISRLGTISKLVGGLAAAIGLFLGGWLAENYGVKWTIFFGGLGMFVAIVFLLWHARVAFYAFGDFLFE